MNGCAAGLFEFGALFPSDRRAMMDRRERLVLTLGGKAVFKANLKPGFQGVMEGGGRVA